MKLIKKQNGITLIALVITIVVLLILAGVSVNAIIGDEGIVNKAKEGQTKVNEEQQKNRDEINKLNTWLSEALNETGNSTTDGSEEEQQELIDTETYYVVYYADFEGDGEIDGIIYADLLIGSNSNGVYTITEAKDYYISQENYTVEGATGYGTKPVLTPIASKKAERFYVMALSDVTSTETVDNKFCWYDAASDSGITEYSSVTSTAFGTGKNNTTVMINAWNAETPAYGARNDNANGYKDMWGFVKEGWFVPSAQEWSAFACALNITDDNFGNYGFDNEPCYWSSSLYSESDAYCMDFRAVLNTRGMLYLCLTVRLSATF